MNLLIKSINHLHQTELSQSTPESPQPAPSRAIAPLTKIEIEYEINYFNAPITYIKQSSPSQLLSLLSRLHLMQSLRSLKLKLNMK